jgi:hypothetical protein
MLLVLVKPALAVSFVLSSSAVSRVKNSLYSFYRRHLGSRVKLDNYHHALIFSIKPSSKTRGISMIQPANSFSQTLWDEVFLPQVNTKRASQRCRHGAGINPFDPQTAFFTSYGKTVHGKVLKVQRQVGAMPVFL